MESKKQDKTGRKTGEKVQKRKKSKKLVKKACKAARRMVLYLSAKRRDKRMTSESRLEVKRKEPIDVRKFRPAPRNQERSKFDKKRKTSKKELDKKSLP